MKTKKELIEALGQYPDDMRIVVWGYEGGYDDAVEIKKIPIKINANTKDYLGKHDLAPEDNADEYAILIG